MTKQVKRILKAFVEQYFSPLKGDSYPDGSQAYYPEQEQTFTDLSHLDSTHGPQTHQEKYPFNYPGVETSNPDWAGGGFQNAYKSDFLNFEKYSPNENAFLDFSLEKCSSVEGNPMNISFDNSSSVDSFLSPSHEIKKLASIDLTEFYKIAEDTLVHKSKKDLWKIFKGSDGGVYIKRMFDGNIIKEEE